MAARELIGYLCGAIGLLLVPVGWITDHRILVLAGLLLGVGFWLLLTERIVRTEAKLAQDRSRQDVEGPDVSPGGSRVRSDEGALVRGKGPSGDE